MVDVTNIPCVLLAGGRSLRFGTDKGLAELGDHTLVEHVASRLRRQTRNHLAINCDPSSPYAKFFDDIVPDEISEDIGPLAGIHAALLWASRNGCSSVATAPIDTPFLPFNYLAQFGAAGASCVARSEERIHPICGLWRTNRANALAVHIRDGMRSVHDWINLEDAQIVSFNTASPDQSFLNINTLDDLALARTILEA